MDGMRIDLQMALAAAAYHGLANAIPMLIKLGADPNACNAEIHPHATALHNAVCSKQDAAIAAYLREREKQG
jgi:hypothetical protein